MDLEERLKLAESKGFISVDIHKQGYVFFLESTKPLKEGDIIQNVRGTEFRVTQVVHKTRVLAEEV